MPPHSRYRKSGVALMAAVALLAIFSMLGVSYLRFMSIENERSRWQGRIVRADTLADDYLRVAIHELNTLVANGGPIPDTLEFPPVPVFVGGRDGPDSLVDSESLRGEIRVTIADEAARLDINRVSSAMIEAATGLSAEKAERIFESTRAPIGQDTESVRLPVRTLEELTTRGLLDEAEVMALPREHLTVFSGPGPFLNANTMPIELLAAVLGLDGDAAEAIAAARPFESREALRDALGPDAGLPPALGVDSRCYRLICEVTLTQPTGDEAWRPVRTHRLEAVVALQSDGPRALYWGPAPPPDEELSAS